MNAQVQTLNEALRERLRRPHVKRGCLFVQWEFPVDNPLDNVRIFRRAGVVWIFCPINCQAFHTLMETEDLDTLSLEQLLKLFADLKTTEEKK